MWKSTGSALGPIKQIQKLINSTEAVEIFKQHASQPPKFVLSSLREFPSLIPSTFQPVPASLLNTPLRRDILWKAVVFDADKARVGASSPPGRTQMGYSTRKLAPQKGTGRARVGDRGSPTRHEGGRALARNAPNQHATDLPEKVYSKAIRIALSDAYNKGKLFVVSNELELPTDDYLAMKVFLKAHKLNDQKLLFITDELCSNLLVSTDKYANKIDIAQKEGIKVKDLLKAEKIFIELNALKFFENKFGEKQAINEQLFEEVEDMSEQELQDTLKESEVQEFKQ